MGGAFCGTFIAFILVMYIVLPSVISPETIAIPVFNQVIKNNQKDYFAQGVANYCSKESDQYQKVICVKDEIDKYFFVDMREDSKIRTPSETIAKGGVCKEYTIMVCSTLKNLDIKCKPHTITGHVFTIAEVNGGYCIIDMNAFECF